MITVYLVDQTTRLHLPESRWAMNVRTKLAEMGHTLQDLGQAPEHDLRTDEEKLRVKALLDSTGL